MQVVRLQLADLFISLFYLQLSRELVVKLFFGRVRVIMIGSLLNSTGQGEGCFRLPQRDFVNPVRTHWARLGEISDGFEFCPLSLSSGLS